MTPHPHVEGFFDPSTHTISYVVSDPETKRAAIIDSVLDYDAASATITTASADALIAYVQTNELSIDWILETHIHADHLTAASYLKKELGGQTGVSEAIVAVQETFAPVFGFPETLPCDGSQFDHLFRDGETFMVGKVPAQVLHVPGHTPADVAFVIGDAVFVGDTLFMPDYGTARCDFPGGSAESLHASLEKLFALPKTTRMFLCHDYLPEGRTEYAWETTIGAQHEHNVHVRHTIDRETFIEMRSKRDATLGMPVLIIPALQVNLCAGVFPRDAEGRLFLRIPVNSVFSGGNGSAP